MSKNREIEDLKQKQRVLKNEIKAIQKSLPIRLLMILITCIIVVLLLEPKYYSLAGNGFSFVRIGVVISIIIALLYYLYSNYIITKKENEKDKIDAKMYSLMKLQKKRKSE